MTPLPKKSYRHQLGPMIHLSTTQKIDPLLLINLENIKVGQISFLNVATFKSAQVPWTYFFGLSLNKLYLLTIQMDKFRACCNQARSVVCAMKFYTVSSLQLDWTYYYKSLRNTCILYFSPKGINVEPFAFHLKMGLFFFFFAPGNINSRLGNFQV